MNKKRFVLCSAIVLFSSIIIILMLSFSIFGSNHPLKKRKKEEVRTWHRREGLVRPVPPYHTFSTGDTIHGIASLYGVSVSDIVRFNKIADERTIEAGTRIFIPTGIDSIRTVSYPGEAAIQNVTLPPILYIRASVVRGRLPLAVEFGAYFDFPDSLKPVWDFGTGQFSFSEFARCTYLKPGKFKVNLSLSDRRGNELISNDLTIIVEKVHIDYDDDLYITMDHVNSRLDLSNRFKDHTGEPVIFNADFRLLQNPALLEYYNDNCFIAVASGYSKVTLSSGTRAYSFYLFVSPFPTQFSVEPEYYWYKTQFDTGMYGNCGPACVAMAVHWATGLKISVIESRQEIGLPISSGALSYYHMRLNFMYHKITTREIVVNDFNDMKALIDRGNIAIILFNTTYIQPVEGDKTLVFVDRYYPDTTGHYVVVKGYTLDGKYLVVYDPIPGNWQNNSDRYKDGVSMIGRNRYFLTDQVFMSIAGRKILEIERRKE
jgi:hypothetical protein